MQSSWQILPRRIGFLGFDGVEALDLTAPLEAFRIADGTDWRAPPIRYETLVIGLTGLFVAESGLRIQADVSLDQAPGLDTIVVPGGAGLREPRTNAVVAEWLRDRAGCSRRLVVPDEGSYVSESNYFNRRWREAFWGEHYPRLAAVKEKYDPEGLFFVHHGVGSDGWSADGFTRLD